jgi:glycosidase
MIKYLSLSVVALAMVACSNQTSQVPTPTPASDNQVAAVSQAKTPEWAKDAVIYQVNTRQYSETGTFEAVEADLSRIKSLGVDILWFMPIHPIGEAKRKGSMGSPYAVKDFQAVNPELGTLEDFKSLVDAAQAMDMKVIIDWVANHTAWDNHLIYDHPEWYTRDENGDMQHPEDTDWVDVADLDYSQQGLRDYMKESLLYWVRDVGIDGYRCDVAGMVPTDFWEVVRPELDAIKPVFMLAEWQEPELHNSAFDASYAWRWKEIMQDIVNGKANAQDMVGYYTDYQENWPKGSMRMAYTSNHDQNTWDGLPQDIYGDAYEAAMALSFVGKGIPLIYNGQESGNAKRLEFFEKDLIEWDETHPNNQRFKDLVDLKTKNDALHNGRWGAPKKIIENSHPKEVLSFFREQDGNVVLAVFNLSAEAQSVSLLDESINGLYDPFKGEGAVSITAGEAISLEPWGYRVFIQ